ncbi:aminoacetone oxidase family FAD-binding enzyme [Bacteroidia bacterium]|nr:aminoacetone oxidase family FAD-binding enzyme [Bacteroidia bacterium]
MKKKIAIIGGGAAGFFTAINIAENTNNADITIYEGSNKVLAKVLISGGGRCNVTNIITESKALCQNYPRGYDFLEPVFRKFSSDDTRVWFEKRGVPLKIEEDGRVFPVSNSSLSIYNCLVDATKSLGIRVIKGKRLTGFNRLNSDWELKFNQETETCDFLVLASGSNQQVYSLIKTKGIGLVAPLPSLFTFNASKHHLLEYAGLSVKHASTSIKEINKSNEQGPLLITHWGYSAPSILKLSAWYARELADLDYKFNLVINWGSYDIKSLTAIFQKFTSEKPKDKVISWKEHGLPKRLWHHIVQYSELKEYTNWSEIGKKGIRRLVNALCSYTVAINGKSTFKEEFVTAGGIDLNEVNSENMSISTYPNLFALGEVLNIDAITGGFNFQAAWSEAYCLSIGLVGVVDN